MSEEHIKETVKKYIGLTDKQQTLIQILPILLIWIREIYTDRVDIYDSIIHTLIYIIAFVYFVNLTLNEHKTATTDKLLILLLYSFSLLLILIYIITTSI